MKSVDKTCCMAGLKMPEMGFKYKAKLISKMRKLAKVAWWGAAHQEGEIAGSSICQCNWLLLP